MLTNRRKIVLLTVLCLVLSLALMAAPKGLAAGGRNFTVNLTGAAELPGPGDPDGSGQAHLTLNHTTGEVCWEIRVKRITLPATAAHIHVGSADVAGPVVVHLSPPDESRQSSGCTTADTALVKAIISNPSAYYVNVHNADFPAGAVRGQLP
jgi:hypothetical protein